jgi:hypothetical protein
MRTLPAAAALLIGVGCSSISTTADFDPATDFSKYKTWAWMDEGPANPKIDQLTDGRIRTATEAELGRRGLGRADKDKADFHVKYHAAVQQKIESRPTTVSVGYGFRYGSVGMSSSNVYTYNEGTLVLDFVDPKAKDLVWRGTAAGTVDPSRTPEERTARIQEAVWKILDQYPPKRK